MFLYDGLVSKHVSCVSMCACVLLFCVRAANLYISCVRPFCDFCVRVFVRTCISILFACLLVLCALGVFSVHA